jgi:hypothetical protein
VRPVALTVLAAWSLSYPVNLFGQSSQPASPPDSVLFHALFRQIAATEQSADAARSQGKSDVSLRDAVKARMGLTDPENIALKQAAQDCNAAYEAESRRGAEIVLKLKAQFPLRSDLPAYAVAQIDGLEFARQQVMTNCVARARKQLGESGFQKVDTFVRQKIAPKVRSLQPKNVK